MQETQSFDSHAPGGHPKTFISYTHDDSAHIDAVLRFATLLRDCGIDVVLDTWAAHERKDWQAWATKNMTESDFVIVVASAGYRRMGDGNGPHERNLGGQAEAALLRDLLQGDRPTWTRKILPVLLPGHTKAEVPRFLQPEAADRYHVETLTEEGIEDLLRVLTRQPRHVRPPLGPLRTLPPESGHRSSTLVAPTATPRWTPLPTALPVIRRSTLFSHHRPQSSTVELHLVPGEPVPRLGVRRLESLPEALATAGRSRQLFSVSQALEAGSNDQAAWAYSADWRAGEAGLAVHRGGQRTCWFQLPSAMIGSILDQDDLTETLVKWIELLVELDLPLPASVAPAIGMDPVGMVRLAALSEASANQASFRGDQPSEIFLGAEETIPAEDFRRFAREIADELTARLAAGLRR